MRFEASVECQLGADCGAPASAVTAHDRRKPTVRFGAGQIENMLL